MSNFYNLSATDLSGKEINFKDYQGQVVLVVNTASECGFTRQYKGLQALHDKYDTKGLKVLAFPCNQFGAQEPGNSDAIGSFCEKNYGVQFKVFEKIEVNGENTHPVYEFLKREKKGLLSEKIKWNFTKFLIDGNGQVLKRYAPQVTPEEIEKEIIKMI